MFDVLLDLKRYSALVPNALNRTFHHTERLEPIELQPFKNRNIRYISQEFRSLMDSYHLCSNMQIIS